MKLLKIDDDQYIDLRQLVAIFFNTKDFHTVVVAAGTGALKSSANADELAQEALALGVDLVEVGKRQYINTQFLLGLGRSKMLGKANLIVSGIGTLESGHSFTDVLARLQKGDQNG